MDFKTKEFTVITPFSIVTKSDATVVDNTNDDIIKIAGMANFSGLDENGKTYVDLVGDVVVPSGVDTSVWGVNPQILWQHDRDETIGEGILLEKRHDGIYIECSIHKGAMDEKDWYRIKSGLVKMFSVGFRTLNGEYKELDGEEVFFITKCLLLEVSVVSIPANSKSGFSLIKSLGEGFTSDTKQIFDATSKHEETNQEEETLMNIKVKRADLLNAEQLVAYKELGGNAEEEVEVSLASFIKELVASEVAATLAAKEKEAGEILAAEEAAKAEADAKAAEEAAKAEADAKAAEEAAKLEEEKQLESELVEYKALLVELRKLITEEN